MNTYLYRVLCCITLVAMLSSCAGTYHAYIDNLKLAFADKSDAELTLEQVRQSTTDLMYVTHGERAQAIMALMYIEAGQHKWVSADNALLIMEQGRLVRTSGFSNDLLFLTNTSSDPIRKLTDISAHTTWLRLADWRDGEYGYALRSNFEVQPNQPLVFFQRQLKTHLVIEHVEYYNSANFIRTGRRWQNKFWFDSASGTLLKTEQQLAPFWQPLTMTFISRVARALPAEGNGLVSGGDNAK